MSVPSRKLLQLEAEPRPETPQPRIPVLCGGPHQEQSACRPLSLRPAWSTEYRASSRTARAAQRDPALMDGWMDNRLVDRQTGKHRGNRSECRVYYRSYHQRTPSKNQHQQLQEETKPLPRLSSPALSPAFPWPDTHQPPSVVLRPLPSSGLLLRQQPA